jgi:hypothetical protein
VLGFSVSSIEASKGGAMGRSGRPVNMVSATFRKDERREPCQGHDMEHPKLRVTKEKKP